MAVHHMLTTLPKPWLNMLAAALLTAASVAATAAPADAQTEIESIRVTPPAVTLGPTTAEPPTVKPYPNSAEISAIPLDQPRQTLLTQLYYLSQRSDFKEREEARDKLCGSVIRRPDTSPNAVKAALTVAEADMNAEVLFEKRKGEGVDTPGQKFSFSIQMSETHVLLRSSSPRFATEASGLSIPFPSDHTRPIWLEGKEGTNMLVLLPTTKECGVRSVALCPRTYDGRGTLVRSKYEPVAARYFIQTKGDGLFSAPKSEPGKIMASVRGSAGVPVPAPWSKESTSQSTVTITYKHLTPPDSQPPFTPITLPWAATVESRLDFGTASAAQREVWSRSTIEISEMKVENWPPVHVRTADLKVESGPCYIVTQFGEKQL